MNTLTVVSLSYRKAPLAVRSEFQMDVRERAQWYEALAEITGIAGGVALSTCNRTEFYLETMDAFCADTFLKTLQRMKNTTLATDRFDVIHGTQASAQYCMEVANGLHSMVLGDKQIINQVKEAYQEAQGAGRVTTLLERLFQGVFRSYKRVHNETLLHKGSRSVSFLALKKIRSLINKPAGEVSILLIGAGEIAADFAKYAASHPTGKVTITNRTMARAVSLGQRFGLTVLPLELIKDELARFDAIVSCASAPGLITLADLPADHMPVSIDLTTYGSLAFTPGITPHFFTLDDLGRERDLNETNQIQAVPQARTIISEEWQVLNAWAQARALRKHQATHIKSILSVTTI